MYLVNQNTPLMFPDGRIMILNEQNQWVQLTPIQEPVAPQLAPTQPQVMPEPQSHTISEELAEELLAEEPVEVEESVPTTEEPVSTETLVNPELSALPALARESCPVVEEEIETVSKPEMRFLSSFDREDNTSSSSDAYPESESGVSVQSSVDFTEDDFVPLAKAVSTKTTPVTKYVVERKVQMRAGVTAKSANVCVLNPGQRVHVVKTQKSRTKAGFVTTKAYVVTDKNQGWVSVNRQNKKTEETFVFRGNVTAQQKKTVVDHNAVWKKHNAEVHDVKTVRHTFHVSVTCPTWQDMEALRANLVSDRLVVSLQDNRKAKLVNKRIPQLVNMRRIFGNNPIVHVYNIDTDYENYHSKFMQNFDWDREFPGSKGNFESQVRKGLQNAHLEARRVTWNTQYEPTGLRAASLAMRDFCTVQFAKHSQLQTFLKYFEDYSYFKGAQVKIDSTYANTTTIPSHLVATDI